MAFDIPFVSLLGVCAELVCGKAVNRDYSKGRGGGGGGGQSTYDQFSIFLVDLVSSLAVSQ